MERQADKSAQISSIPVTNHLVVFSREGSLYQDEREQASLSVSALRSDNKHIMIKYSSRLSSEYFSPLFSSREQEFRSRHREFVNKSRIILFIRLYLEDEYEGDPGSVSLLFDSKTSLHKVNVPENLKMAESILSKAPILLCQSALWCPGETQGRSIVLVIPKTKCLLCHKKANRLKFIKIKFSVSLILRDKFIILLPFSLLV